MFCIKNLFLKKFFLEYFIEIFNPKFLLKQCLSYSMQCNLTTKRTVRVPTSITPTSGPGLLPETAVSSKRKNITIDLINIHT